MTILKLLVVLSVISTLICLAINIVAVFCSAAVCITLISILAYLHFRQVKLDEAQEQAEYQAFLERWVTGDHFNPYVDRIYSERYQNSGSYDTYRSNRPIPPSDRFHSEMQERVNNEISMQSVIPFEMGGSGPSINNF